MRTEASTFLCSICVCVCVCVFCVASSLLCMHLEKKTFLLFFSSPTRSLCPSRSISFVSCDRWFYVFVSVCVFVCPLLCCSAFSTILQNKHLVNFDIFGQTNGVIKALICFRTNLIYVHLYSVYISDEQKINYYYVLNCLSYCGVGCVCACCVRVAIA